MNNLETELTTIKKLIFSFIAFFLLVITFFIIDYIYTNFFRVANTENDYRIRHEFYHHTLAKSFNGFDGWGLELHQVCTDMNGFKSSCDKFNVLNRKFDIAFIGDSFTEGSGMLYEDTFVGIFSDNHPKLKVANLGVSSYSPTIYLAKIKYLLDQNYSFKHLYVFIDISDIQDESRYSVNSSGIVISDHQSVKADSKLISLRDFIFNNFKIFYFSVRKLKESLQTLKAETQNETDVFKLSRSEWTSNPNSTAYGLLGVEGSILQAEKNMEELYRILNDRDILLSIGVYPWPAQLLEIRDNKNKINRHVSIWKNFCEQRCSNFINLFPKYKDLITQNGVEHTYKKYFIAGDVHYNKAGYKLISEAIIYNEDQ